MRISMKFYILGTICFTVKSMAHTLDPKATKPIHLEPLDLKKLQQKCLKDYLKDIADAEKVSIIFDFKFQRIASGQVYRELSASSRQDLGCSGTVG